MHRLARTAAAVTLIATANALTACGAGNNGLTPTSTTVSQGGQGSSRSLHPMDITADDLHAGGGPFAAYAYSGAVQPAGDATNPSQPLPLTPSLFANYPGTANIYYCQTPSDFGKSIFDGTNLTGAASTCANFGDPPTGFGGRQDPPDFAGTDVPFNTMDYAAYSANRKAKQGEPVEFPSLAGPVVFGYNPKSLPGLGAKRLQLSRWSYCAISTGVVTDFNDPAITADNGGKSVTGGKSVPIAFFFRNDPNGLTFALQHNLKAACTGAYIAPYNKYPYQSATRNAVYNGNRSENWDGPTTGNFSGTQTDTAEQTAILNTPGGFGYLEGPAASQVPGLRTALLQNRYSYLAGQRNFVDTTTTAQEEAIEDAKLDPGGSNTGSIPTTRKECLLYVRASSIADSDEVGAYPIMLVSYMLFYNHNNMHAANLQSLIKFIAQRGGSADTIVINHGYVPMPAPIKAAMTFGQSCRNCVH